MAEAVDQEARRNAEKAHNRIDEAMNAIAVLAQSAAVTAQTVVDHEKHCAEARTNTNAALAALRSAVDSLKGTWVKVGAWAIMVLGGAVVGLLVYIWQNIPPA